jgi:hypothetical protein
MGNASVFGYDGNGRKIWIFEEFSGWMKEKLGCAFRVKTLESPWLVSKVSG